MEKRSILVFPGGTEIGLEIFKSLKYIKNIKLYSASIDVLNPAPFYFKDHLIIPSIYEENWITELNNIIEKFSIDYIFPAYDDIIVELAKNKEKIEAQIISSPLKTCLQTRSKSKTYEILKNIIPIPKIYESEDDVNNFPVFLKPDKGQGSKNTYKVKSPRELSFLMKKHENLLILEYLSGKEYTIDCFTDREDGLLFCEGRERRRIRSGISVNSKIIFREEFESYAKLISEYFNFYGAWFFQLKEDREGILKLMEIAPRIAGTMALNRVRGINFPLLSIYEKERIKVKTLINNYEIIIDRSFKNKYKITLNYDYVYIDLDDTIIINGKLNLLIIRFLYQCINRDIKIALLTRHKKDIESTLNRFKISKNIFDKIIVVNENEKKSNYIKNHKSIFIDDSFRERLDISKNLKIPTFDCSMIECLLDDKV